MMLLNYEDLSSVKKAVEVEIPADRISTEAQRVTTEFSRHAKLPGFRPGKVPANVVRTRFAKEIQEEVMSRLLPLSFREAIADKNVEPVGDPRLQRIDPYIEGAPVKYKAEFEVKPQIELGDYRGIEIDDPKIEVSDSDVENMIERLVIMSEGDAIDADLLPPGMVATTRASESHVPTTLAEGGVNLNAIVRELEGRMINEALRQTGGNKQAAARLLGLKRTTFSAKLRRCGVIAPAGSSWNDES